MSALAAPPQGCCNFLCAVPKTPLLIPGAAQFRHCYRKLSAAAKAPQLIRSRRTLQALPPPPQRTRIDAPIHAALPPRTISGLPCAPDKRTLPQRLLTRIRHR
ncbi:hypothetical protein Xcc1_29850 [Xanthomonas campestris pv. campestris]|nr:hypothetical protein Xcc1_29850 [Xanthomonas campestris pv. campestris]